MQATERMIHKVSVAEEAVFDYEELVGAGMESHPGTAAKMFEALYEHDINIDMIATSEIKISVLIDAKDADRAVAAVHRAFFPA